MQERNHRVYTTSEIVVALGASGIPMTTISRALVVRGDQVESILRTAHRHGVIDRLPPQGSENPREPLLTEITNLRAQVSDLKFQMREMSEKKIDASWSLKSAFGLTRQEATILAGLIEHGRMSKPGLYHLCYGSRADEDQPDPKIIDVFVCKLRAKLEPFGIEVDTVWGFGYEMKPDAIAKVRCAIAPVPAVLPFVETLATVPAL